MTFGEARDIDMVDYLSSIGYKPEKIKKNDYWYLSPLRNEKTASFKINRAINRWYDHGTGQGGNLIDFAILYHNCTIAELMQKLQQNISFQQRDFRHAKPISEENKIIILKDSKLNSFGLLNYLKERNIPFEIADQYCREIHYQLDGKTYYSIGFKNDAGGFELRNRYFKNSSRPKAITTFKNRSPKCAVFEGFFDFLSFMFLLPKQEVVHWDFCILNSLSFFKNSFGFLDRYSSIHLFLDNDPAGQNASRIALESNKKFVDESSLYTGYKDLNEWIVNIGRTSAIKEEPQPP